MTKAPPPSADYAKRWDKVYGVADSELRAARASREWHVEDWKSVAPLADAYLRHALAAAGACVSSSCIDIGCGSSSLSGTTPSLLGRPMTWLAASTPVTKAFSWLQLPCDVLHTSPAKYTLARASERVEGWLA